jgi:hypothetical protein
MSYTDDTNDRRENQAFEPIRPQASGGTSAPAHQQRRSFFWPIALIGFGVLLLLSNMGLIPATGWAILWRLWPIALIALGVDVLIGSRSVAGAIASGVLVLVLVGIAIGIAVFAEQIPVLVELAKPPTLQFEYVEYPLGDAERANVTLDYTSVPGYLSALDDSGNLIEADVAYRGELSFRTSTSGSTANVSLDSYTMGVSFDTFSIDDARARWDVQLSPNATLDLDLDAGSGRCNFDLSELSLSELTLDVGSGAVDLALPAAGSFRGTVDGGSGALRIELPSNVGLRIELDDGSGAFHPGDRLRMIAGDEDDDSVWETEGYESAEHQIELIIDQGSGAIRIN